MFGKKKGNDPLAEELFYVLQSAGLISGDIKALMVDTQYRVVRSGVDCRISTKISNLENTLGELIPLLKEAGIIEDVPCECGSGKTKLRLKGKKRHA